MARSLLFSALALANTATCMTAWWTDLSPGVAMQDPASGDIWHSSCNSNKSPIFPIETPNVFPLKIKPRNGTALAVAGWWNSRKTIASVFYQSADLNIVNGYFECNMKTGVYENFGEYIISETGGVPSVNAETGFTVELLGDVLGYRLFYHDDAKTVNYMSYTDDSGWQYSGQISQDPVTNMVLHSTHTGDVNMSVIWPKDSSNIEISRLHSDEQWHLTSLPRPLKGVNLTQLSAPDQIRLDDEAQTNFTLPSWTGTPQNIGIGVNRAHVRSIYYLGSDKKLHQLSNINYVWRLMPDQIDSIWPEADVAGGQLATVSSFSTNRTWLWYWAGGKLQQIFYSGEGLWQEATEVPVKNTTVVPADDPEPSQPTTSPTNTPGSSSSGLSTGAKAGIGIAVAVGVLAFAGIAGFFFFLRRKRQRAAESAKNEPAEIPHDEYQQNSPAYPYQQVAQVSPSYTPHPYTEYAPPAWEAKDGSKMSPPPAEADSRTMSPPQELEGPSPMYELAHHNYSHELVGEGQFREELDGSGGVRQTK